MKPNKIHIALLMLIAVSAIPLVRAGGGCCGGTLCSIMAPAQIPAGLASDARPMADAVEQPALMEPVKSVYNHYLKIQGALAKDSMAGVAEEATAMTKAIKGDDMKMLSPEIARQAETLAQAKDLKAARQAFKPLSESLIKYLADHKVQSGAYNEAYCPMADASWLQTGRKISNPYLGKEMPTCGEIKRKF